jgi:hypothetical protein
MLEFTRKVGMLEDAGDGVKRWKSIASERPSTGAPPSLTTMKLEKRLACAITRETEGLVCVSRVQIFARKFALHGRAESHHAVPLAHAALLKMLNGLGCDHPEEVELNIEIVPTLPRGSQSVAGASTSSDPFSE